MEGLSRRRQGTTTPVVITERVAYDTRDLNTTQDSINPKLTIMEEVLLLGLKDKQVSTSLTTTHYTELSITAKGIPIILE